MHGSTLGSRTTRIPCHSPESSLSRSDEHQSKRPTASGRGEALPEAQEQFNDLGLGRMSRGSQESDATECACQAFAKVSSGL
ncbi:hypothetical protein DAEQUDRAFT_726483 [Daedalea quercina L-15889]|uniref:Uncharacterized protein n=1 Tax=Daedalea quercina L-15889 TaxID=1314783 RepID=A0A165KFS8_9APHY|nr:hypothetical protein DAEQUDRAFT_734233 [Daedalea quercina L-15889]KZT69517.1 hypothetical protein DAEQUDRAFT_726483 [Daedalea quercina L-15889]